MDEPEPPPEFDLLIKHVLKAVMFIAPAVLLMLGVAVYLVIQAPDDYQHAMTGKILYIHVPSAWLATLCYIWMTLCALAVIFRNTLPARQRLGRYLGQCLGSAAPLGATFTLLTLVTGALWGQPAWGTWWVWDARLTSVLMLFILYLVIIAVEYRHHQTGNPQTGTPSRSVAIVTLFGLPLVPIIKFSVVWWQTLHQPTSLWRSEGVAMEAEMLLALMAMALAFTLLFICLQLLALRARLLGECLLGEQVLGEQVRLAPHAACHPVKSRVEKPQSGHLPIPLPGQTRASSEKCETVFG